MKKHFILSFPLSIVTAVGVSAPALSQPNIISSFSVRGGDVRVNSGKDPNIKIQEIQKGNSSDPNRQTWIVIHGWNDKPENTDLSNLATIIKSKKPNDQVLMLDWHEASNIGSLVDFGNYQAATWVSPVAVEVVKRLKELNIAPENLNLVGHSLGTLISSEIGRSYQCYVKCNDDIKVKKIIALEPPAATLDKVSIPYFIDTKGNEMTPFKAVATISKAFVGKTSISGSYDLAATANESYLFQFNKPNDISQVDGNGMLLDPAGQHQIVIDAYNNLVKNGLPQVNGGKNDILSLDSGNIDIKKNDYNGSFEGQIIVNRTDGNQPYRLYVKDPQTGQENLFGEPDRITKVGTYIGNTITYTRDETGKIINTGIDVTGKIINTGIDVTGKGINAGIDATGKIIKGGRDIISSIFTPIPIYAPGYEVNQDTYQQQTQNTLMLNGINGITQGNVSPIGSPSTSFIAYNPTVDLSKPRTENIQEKNQYTDGTIVKAPLDIGLTWNQSTKLDLDSHTVTPSGDHVYFNQRGSLTNSPNTFLYRDSIPAGGKLGAEQTRITTFQEGEYRFYVYNYSDQQNLFPFGLPTSAAKVQLFQGGAPLTDIPNDPNNFDLNNPALQKVGQPYPGTNTFNVPTGQSGNAWYVFKLNTRTGILNRVDRFGNVDSSSKIPTFK
jgi:pimeloyl-ACP methyl ester carboxylesterase